MLCLEFSYRGPEVAKAMDWLSRDGPVVARGMELVCRRNGSGPNRWGSGRLGTVGLALARSGGYPTGYVVGWLRPMRPVVGWLRPIPMRSGRVGARRGALTPASTPLARPGLTGCSRGLAMVPVIEGLSLVLLGMLMDSGRLPEEAPSRPEMEWVPAVNSMGSQTTGSRPLAVVTAEGLVVAAAGLMVSRWVICVKTIKPGGNQRSQEQGKPQKWSKEAQRMGSNKLEKKRTKKFKEMELNSKPMS